MLILLIGEKQLYWKHICEEMDRICWFLQLVHLSIGEYYPLFMIKAGSASILHLCYFIDVDNKKPHLFMFTWNEGDLSKDTFIYHPIAGLGLLQVYWKSRSQITQVVQRHVSCSYHFLYPRTGIFTVLCVGIMALPPRTTHRCGPRMATALSFFSGRWLWKVRWKCWCGKVNVEQIGFKKRSTQGLRSQKRPLQPSMPLLLLQGFWGQLSASHVCCCHSVHL